jgi:hypothetical protein
MLAATAINVACGGEIDEQRRTEPSKARSVQLEAADTEITGEEIPARGECARASEQHLQLGGCR